MKLSKISFGLHSLTVFRALLADETLSALLRFIDLRISNEKAFALADAYADFVSKLYNAGGNLHAHISAIVNNDENVYIRKVGTGEEIDEYLLSAVKSELETLSATASITGEVLCEGLEEDGVLPKFETESGDLAEPYFTRAKNIGKYGYGIYAKYRMFYLSDNNEIVPVCHPDPISLNALAQYKREQEIIMKNTRALLEGKPAANILLTGDAGTGKSSTVKAVVNELYSEGLRILEVRKEQLHAIPAILDELSVNPLKFIIFIDDLSFGKDDDNFGALKAILEGSVSAKSQNVAIYATSNRRHLVKESFADREGDDIHFNDTLQEILSLSDRFGIRVTFSRPDKATYLDIVRSLAVARGLDFDPEILYKDAERFALERGGRSPRAARQFVDSLLSKDK